jgi:hypothetical protein
MRTKYEVGDIVLITPESRSSGWFEGLGPFLVVGVEEDEPDYRGRGSLWLDLTNLDGSRCAKQICGTDADADDCRKDAFLTEARRANVQSA